MRIRDGNITRLIVVVFLCGSLLASGNSPAAAIGGAFPDLAGRWAKKVVLTSVATPPVVGKVTSRMETHLIVDVDQSGRQVVLQPETCDVAINSDFKLVRTVLPNEFTRAVPDERRDGLIVGEKGDFRLHINRNRTVVGASLREPSSEVLPSKPNDPRVVDADQDGKPGITIEIEGLVQGRVFLVQRAWDLYDADVTTSDKIEGTVDWNVEQAILGSSSVFLRKPPAVRPHPDPAKSRFEMVRVSSKSDCSDVLERRKELFDH